MRDNNRSVNKKILVIGHDDYVIQTVAIAFQLYFPEIELLCTTRTEKGIQLVQTEKPNIVVFEILLNDNNSHETIKKIRQFSDAPILILSEITDETDIVKYLELGADDFVNKPYKQLEILARVNALLHHRNNSDGETNISCGPINVGTKDCRVFFNSVEVNLTRSEYLILRHLLINAGHPVTYPDLAKALWGTDYPNSTRALKVYVMRLRKKLHDHDHQPHLILNKEGFGYALVA